VKVGGHLEAGHLDAWHQEGEWVHGVGGVVSMAEFRHGKSEGVEKVLEESLERALSLGHLMVLLHHVVAHILEGDMLKFLSGLPLAAFESVPHCLHLGNAAGVASKVLVDEVLVSLAHVVGGEEVPDGEDVGGIGKHVVLHSLFEAVHLQAHVSIVHAPIIRIVGNIVESAVGDVVEEYAGHIVDSLLDVIVADAPDVSLVDEVIVNVVEVVLGEVHVGTEAFFGDLSSRVLVETSDELSVDSSVSLSIEGELVHVVLSNLLGAMLMLGDNSEGFLPLSSVS